MVVSERGDISNIKKHDGTTAQLESEFKTTKICSDYIRTIYYLCK